MANALTILGVDPGLRRTGYGVIAVDDHKMRPLDWGVIAGATDDARLALAPRIARIFNGLSAVIDRHHPHYAAVEIVFVNVNPQSTLLLGQARGAAISALTHAHIPIWELTALQVKQGVVGYGRASKEQIRTMVRTHLQIPETQELSFDSADALACALTAAYQHRARQTLISASNHSPMVSSAMDAYRRQTRGSRRAVRWQSLPK